MCNSLGGAAESRVQIEPQARAECLRALHSLLPMVARRNSWRGPLPVGLPTALPQPTPEALGQGVHLLTYSLLPAAEAAKRTLRPPNLPIPAPTPHSPAAEAAKDVVLAQKPVISDTQVRCAGPGRPLYLYTLPCLSSQARLLSPAVFRAALALVLLASRAGGFGGRSTGHGAQQRAGSALRGSSAY